MIAYFHKSEGRYNNDYIMKYLLKKVFVDNE